MDLNINSDCEINSGTGWRGMSAQTTVLQLQVDQADLYHATILKSIVYNWVSES